MINIQQILASDTYESMVEKINQGFVQLASLQGGPRGKIGGQGIPGLPGKQGMRGYEGQEGRAGTQFLFMIPPEEEDLSQLIQDGEYFIGDTFIHFDVNNNKYTYYKIIESTEPSKFIYEEYSIDLSEAGSGANIWASHIHNSNYWSIIINNDIRAADFDWDLLEVPDNDTRKHFTFNTFISSANNSTDRDSLINESLTRSGDNPILFWSKRHFKLSLDQKLPYNLPNISRDDFDSLKENKINYHINQNHKQYLNLWESYSFGNKLDFGDLAGTISVDDFNLIKNTSPVLYLQSNSQYLDSEETIQDNFDSEYENFGFFVKRVRMNNDTTLGQRYKSVLILASDEDNNNDIYLKTKNLWTEGNFVSEINSQNEDVNERFYTPLLSKKFNGDNFNIDDQQKVFYGFGDYGLTNYGDVNAQRTGLDLDSGFEVIINNQAQELEGSVNLKLTKTTINSESLVRDSNNIMIWRHDKVGINLGEGEEPDEGSTCHINGQLMVGTLGKDGSIRIQGDEYNEDKGWFIQPRKYDLDIGTTSTQLRTLNFGLDEGSNVNVNISGTLKITGGDPAENKVLTSMDGEGNAIWKKLEDVSDLSRWESIGSPDNIIQPKNNQGLRIEYGGPAENKVLTSTDNHGTATWKKLEDVGDLTRWDLISDNIVSDLRLPTEAEWEAERLSWSTNNTAGAFDSPLILAVAGVRYGSNGSLDSVGSDGFYWSSTVVGTYSRYLLFFSSNANMSSHYRASGLSVRLIKDGTVTEEQYESTYENNTIEINGLPYGYCYNHTTQRVWLDRNLGATQVAESSTDSAAYGDLYQWGRATDGHQLRTSGTTSTLSDSDTPGHDNFITIDSSPSDWRSPQNDDLWQGVGGINTLTPFFQEIECIKPKSNVTLKIIGGFPAENKVLTSINNEGNAIWKKLEEVGDMSKWVDGVGDNIYRESGNVGIGTTDPGVKLDVRGNLGFHQDNTLIDGIIWKNMSYAKESASIKPVDLDNWARQGIGFFTGDNADDSTDAQERMRILRNGNVEMDNNLSVAGSVIADSVDTTGSYYMSGARQPETFSGTADPASITGVNGDLYFQYE